jgi:hypothetical protein
VKKGARFAASHKFLGCRMGGLGAIIIVLNPPLLKNRAFSAG